MEDVLQLLRQLFILGQDSAAAGMFLGIYSLILLLLLMIIDGKSMSAALHQFFLGNVETYSVQIHVIFCVHIL